MFGQTKALREAATLLDNDDLRDCLRIAGKLSKSGSIKLAAVGDFVGGGVRDEMTRRGLKP